MIKAKDDKNKINRDHMAFEEWELKLVIAIVLAFILGIVVGLHFNFNPLLDK